MDNQTVNYQLSDTKRREITRDIRCTRRKMGTRLKDLRHKHRITLKQLSRRTGLSPHTLDHLELGKGNLNLRHITTVCRAFGVSLERFLGG